MSMSANLMLATEQELKKLKAKPTSINDFASAGCYFTHYFCTINYFTTGDAWDNDALFGIDTVSCSTLENGNFGVVKPSQVAKVLAKLEKIDLKKVKKDVEAADPEQLAEEEVDDYEQLAEDDEAPGKVIVSEIKSLIAFYKKAASKKCGVVMYIS